MIALGERWSSRLPMAKANFGIRVTLRVVGAYRPR